jgi:parallel beta-helix repeat protein
MTSSSRSRRRARRSILLVAALSLVQVVTSPVASHGAVAVDEVHYTFTGPTSVAFDWRGDATDLRYGPTSNYGTTLTAHAPSPTPFSSAGPFREVDVTGLEPGTTYHYSIGGGPDQTFSTEPSGSFRFDAVGDIGSSNKFPAVATTMNQIAADHPAFVLMDGDLTYANPNGQASVDQHFNDAMAWTQSAAYMPVWGNHEWDDPTTDDLRNYKGRFELPNPQTSPGAPAMGCCGEDWSWFDAGGVRFISYPEPYTSSTWDDWQTQANGIMAAAQADPSINFIVTFGHRPAYSSGFHPGDDHLASILDGFGSTYPKYVLDLNGHSHDYERFNPIQHVVHITAGGGGAPLEPLGTLDPRSAFLALHLAHLRVDVTANGIRVDAICGPATSADNLTCSPGDVIDSVTIGDSVGDPAPTPQSTIHVDINDPNCSNIGPGTQAQPLCSIATAALRAVGGQTVVVASGTYDERVKVANSGSQGAPIVFTTAPGANVTVTGGSNGFYLYGRSWITVQGFNVTGTTSDGIYVANGSNVSIVGNRVTYSGLPVSGQTGKGIRISNCTASIVAGNRVDHNSDHGIYITTGTTGTSIVDNFSSYNATQFSRVANGINVYRSPGNSVEGNVTHDNEDSGIQIYTASDSSLVRNNVSFANGDHGIDVLNALGGRVVGNSVYRNVTAGINVEGSSSAALANNISVDNGIGSSRTQGNIRVDSTSMGSSTLDYDEVYLSTDGTQLTWGNTKYGTLAAFTNASGQEQHGLEADPLWKSPTTNDFHLAFDSPAIDSANAGADGQPSVDADSFPRVDDPAVPDTGAGPRSYDDRGAFEFQAPTNVDSPPLAFLEVTPSSGQAPLTVGADASESSDTDASPIDTYRFDFGDGAVVGPQSSPTASHAYTEGGDYTVTVTIRDTIGFTATATAAVHVDNPVADLPPAASLSVTPTSGIAPLDVHADASASSDADATPISAYTFNFGDGTTVGPQPSATADHTYVDVGTFTVTVTVTDSGGLASQANASVATSVNLVTNPGFETDLKGWNTSGSGSGISLSRVSDGHSGGWSAQLSNTGTTSSSCLLNDSPNWVSATVDRTYTGALWVRADAAGATLKLRWREYSGSTPMGAVTTTVPLTTSWQQVSLNYTPAAPGASNLDLNAFVSNAAPGTCFYADDVMITRS